MSDKTPVIRMRNISKSFGGVHALKNVQLDIFSGEVHALLGENGAGKSTLINRIMGSKGSIVTAKPQTTRHRILAVHTIDAAQIVFVDTPGLHRNASKAMNRLMNGA